MHPLAAFAALGARATALLLGATLCIPGHARAQASQSLAVLAVFSEEGDDALAAAVTTALRDEAAASFAVADSRASLSQMTMAQDCEISEADCRARVAGALSVERVIYGQVRRTRPSGYQVTLHMFAAAAGPETTTERAIPEGETEGADLARHAQALLRALQGLPEQQSEQPSGSAKRTVAADVRPLADTESAPPASSEPDRVKGASNDWLGYTLLGVGGVSAGLLAYSWIQISSATDEPAYMEYREAVGSANPRVDDVCSEADAGRGYGVSSATLVAARDACSQGQTFETLQFVFAGLALAAVGAGVYFLVDDEGPEASAAAGTPRLALRPALHPRRAGLELGFRF